MYAHLKKDFAKHEVVRHGAGEYVRGEAHTNNLRLLLKLPPN